MNCLFLSMTDLPTERNFPTTLEDTLTYNADAIRMLATQLKSNRKVLPFVGAGLSAAYRFKTWRAFLVHYAEEWGVKDAVIQLLNESKYEAAADKLLEAMDEHAFNKAVNAEYGKHRLDPFTQRGVFHFLPRLTVGPILTTNYDRIIESCYQILGLPIERVVGARITATQQIVEQDRAILVKVHGDSEELSERILTGSEYDQHYGIADDNIFDATLPLPKVLMKLMSGTPLLFLGCSLETDRTLSVLGQISKDTQHGGHYALVPFPEKPADLLARKRHFSSHRITPIWYEPIDHHRLLAELLDYLCQDLRDPTQDTSPTTEGNFYLQINEPFFGREIELQALRNWLASSTSVGNVHSTYNIKGAPGIGKSRLCHRFLQEYLAAAFSHKVHYIELTGAQNAASFLAKLMEGLHLPEIFINAVVSALHNVDKAAAITSMRTVVSLVDQVGGIVYLDNLEDVLKDPNTEGLLAPFAHMQRTRLLCSSRKTLPTDIASNLQLDRLDDEAAEHMFIEHWKRSGAKEIVLDTVAKAFIHEELDNHALSIKLVAAQGHVFASQVQNLVAQWKKAALDLAHSGAIDPDKQHSLEISLNLSFEALRILPQNPILFWALVAMFPEGMSIQAQERLSESAWYTPTPPIILIQHSILERDEQGRLRMLAPVREYILAQLRTGAGGLDWIATLAKVVEKFLLPIIKEAEAIELIDAPDKGSKYHTLLNEFPALAFWVEEANRKDELWKARFAEFLHYTQNFLLRRPLISHGLLKLMVLIFERNGMGLQLASAFKILADLDQRLGYFDDARVHYMKAIELFKKEGSAVGLANVFHSLGELEIRHGKLDDARNNYLKSIELYQSEHDDIGLANTLKNLGDLYLLLRELDNAYVHYLEAAKLHEKEHNNLGLANVLQKLGDIICIEKPDDAHNYYLKAIELFEKECSDLGLANTLHCLGNLYIHIGEPEEARTLLLKAIKLYQKEHDELGLANTFQSLGNLEMGADNLEEALDRLEEAARLYIKEQEPLGHACSLALIAKIHHKLGKIGERDVAYSTALNKAQESNIPGVLNYVQNIGETWVS